MERFFTDNKNLSIGVGQKTAAQKKQVVRAFYFFGSMSNAELSKILKLSVPKINNLLLDLIEDGLVNELGRGESRGGRRPNIYGLAENKFYVAGISININRTIISIFNSNNKEVGAPLIIPVKIESDFEIFHSVSNALTDILTEKGIDKSSVLAVGVELPGLFNDEQEISKTYFPEIENLSSELRKIFKLPVFISHDSKLRAFTEQHFGLAKNKKNVLVVQADLGLGLGIIINGRLYFGKSGYSGEFGHFPIVENGILCRCGKQGCLETIVSADAIARVVREGIENGQSSLVSELVYNDPEQIDISTVIEAANRGDQFAISVFSDVGFWLGKGIVYLLQVFNPELIIIGGRISEAGQFIFAPLQQAIYTFSNRDISDDAEIKFSALGQKAGPLGAAAYAVDRISVSDID